MSKVRRAAVAGSFYPGRAGELRTMIDEMLAEGRAEMDDDLDAPHPKAVIAPHAGYIYSGPIAAKAYLRLAAGRETIRKVVLLGPSHFVWLDGLAVTSADEFETPLGRVPIDAKGRAAIQSLRQVKVNDHPHLREHSLEVQVPFLQVVLSTFELLPIAVGESKPTEVAEVLDRVWGGEETVIVISSDLSHYHPYEVAQRIDGATAAAIDSLDRTDILPEEACGCRPVNGMILAAREHVLKATRLDLRNSGDTAGPRDGVVGYGAWELR